MAIAAATWWHDAPEDTLGNDDTLGPTAGGEVRASYERGFTDAWSWRVDVSGGVYGRDGASFSALAAAGVVYRFDVLRYVPYAFVELGGVALVGAPFPGEDSSSLDPVVLFGVGVDILRDRDSSWGLELRGGGLIGDAGVASLGLRNTWRWGYF